MASVNFEKLKLPQQVKSMLYHCDKETRQNTNHSNIDIDKSATPKNMQGNRSYQEACMAYDDLIASLDAKPGANKRKDRVTCFGLTVPAPKDLKPEDEKTFFLEAVKLIAEQYGSDNIIQYYIHQDEKHTYVNVETKQLCESRSHLHCYVVPQHNGKLNGKWFSSRSNMVRLNNAIHKMAQEQFGIMFMDGTKKKSRKTVEQLKNESTYLEAQMELDRQRASLSARESAVHGQETALNFKVEELQHEEEKSLKRQRMLSKKEADLDSREDDLKAYENEQKAALQQAAEMRDMASNVLLTLQQMEEENKQLIALGREQQRRQRLTALDTNAAIQAYNQLDSRIESLVPQA